MRIVIATPFYPPEQGVLGTYAMGLRGAFEREGHEIVIVSFGAVRAWPPIVRHFLYFLKILFVRRANFMLALDTWSVGMPAYFAARLKRVPFLVRVGGDLVWEAYVERTQELIRFSAFYEEKRTLALKERLLLRFHRLLGRSAHALLFNSRFQRDIWQKAYSISEKKTHILENVFPAERAMGEPQGRVFVSAGRPIVFKNYAVVERAFARVKAKYPDIELDRRLLPREAHLARLRNAYAVVIPSVSEISSNTAIDAVVSGKPFIMTDDTGTKERLGEYGLFVDTRSEDALVGAIEEMLDKGIYERLRTNIRALSFSRSWDDLAREILVIDKTPSRG